MPTIEIASIEANSLNLNQNDFDVAIIEENKLISHRGLFHDFLIRQSGTIVHIGNPDLKNEEFGFFAGKIINWDFDPRNVEIPKVNLNAPTDTLGENQQFLFQFSEKYKADIDKILKVALEKSPIKRIFFLTDYQFGPENGSKEIIYTIRDFWAKHDKEGLRLNRLYEIYGE